jgi:hypothetical protein
MQNGEEAGQVTNATSNDVFCPSLQGGAPPHRSRDGLQRDADCRCAPDVLPTCAVSRRRVGRDGKLARAPRHRRHRRRGRGGR